MTSTSRVANELAALLVPIGYAGAALAVICAIVAGIAIMRGAGGLSGGAVGLWIPCALMSSTASFSRQWTPLVVAGAALVAMLVIGGVVRAITARAEVPVVTRPRPVVVTSKAATPAKAATTDTAAVPAGRLLREPAV